MGIAIAPCSERQGGEGQSVAFRLACRQVTASGCGFSGSEPFLQPLMAALQQWRVTANRNRSDTKSQRLLFCNAVHQPVQPRDDPFSFGWPHRQKHGGWGAPCTLVTSHQLLAVLDLPLISPHPWSALLSGNLYSDTCPVHAHCLPWGR